MTTIFHPVEQAILCDYFGVPRPKHCRNVDITRPPDEQPDSICVIDIGNDSELALKNAVARIALEAIQDRLPNCAVFSAEEGVALCRKRFTQPNRPVELLPIPLFTINWADSAPGFSWPECYHATFVPGFGRYVVTAALDSPDVHGYTELAIGWFPDKQEIKAGAHDVIVAWWRWQHDSWGQAPWAYVWDEYLISEDTAEDWADEIWACGVGDFSDEVAAVLAPESDTSDRHSALFAITKVMAEPENIFSHRARERANSAFEKCLYSSDISRAVLIDVIDFVRQLGCLGRVYVDELLKRFSANETASDRELRMEILAALESVAPRDKNVLKTVSKRLLDSREGPSVRWQSARVLFKITGLDEFNKILQLPTVRSWREVKSRIAPWDSEIYIGREWYVPHPDQFQKQLAARCLTAMMKELGESPQAVPIVFTRAPNAGKADHDVRS